MATELDISTKNCTIEKDGHVLIVTLNRPEAKNALSSQMILGMYNAWRLLDSDPDLRVGVLTGKGDTFCSGMDLKSGTDGDADAAMMQEKNPRPALAGPVTPCPTDEAYRHGGRRLCTRRRH